MAISIDHARTFLDLAPGLFAFTPEETDYCLQVLSLWQRNGHSLPGNDLQPGRIWLDNHMERLYPMMWIGKSLYFPELVVYSRLEHTDLGRIKKGELIEEKNE